jgi:hypothetical protein
LASDSLPLDDDDDDESTPRQPLGPRRPRGPCCRSTDRSFGTINNAVATKERIQNKKNKKNKKTKAIPSPGGGGGAGSPLDADDLRPELLVLPLLRVDDVEADDDDEFDDCSTRNEPPRDEPRDIFVDVAELLFAVMFGRAISSVCRSMRLFPTTVNKQRREMSTWR